MQHLGIIKNKKSHTVLYITVVISLLFRLVNCMLMMTHCLCFSHFSLLSFPLLSLFGGNSFSVWPILEPANTFTLSRTLTEQWPYTGGAHRQTPEQWAAAVQRPGAGGGFRCFGPFRCLKGTSSVDEDAGECCTTTPPVHIFSYWSGFKLATLQFNSLTSRPRMPTNVVPL